MDSVGNGNGQTGLNQRKSFNLGHDGDTQLLDSQLLPSGSPTADVEMAELEAADQHFQGCTIPYDDTVPIHDEFETQMVNPGGEMQVDNFGAETQVMGTQLLDEFATQVVTDDESEETCGTEVSDAGNCSSDEDSIRKGTGSSADVKKMQFGSPCKKDENREKASHLSDELCGSASPRRFTSIRAASVRASGLAARSASRKKTDSVSHDLPNSGRSSQETHSKSNGLSHKTISSNSRKEDDHEQVSGRLDGKEEEPREGNKCKIGSSAVRRLFTEHENTERDSKCFDEGDEELNIAGLTYIDSQEPGDLSQAYALDFVDQFLKDNLGDHHQDSAAKTTAARKSASVPSTKGPQLLAASRAYSKDSGIFEWDDDMEDEGGGEIFRKKKDEFFKGKRILKSWAKPQNKLKGSRVDESKIINNVPLVFQEKTRGLARSAPLVKFDKRGEIGNKIRADDRCAKRNLKDEFFRAQAEDISNVGPDTQLAAEAMEALCGDGDFMENGEREVQEMQNLAENGSRNRKDGSDGEMRKKSPPISLRRSSRNINKRNQTENVNTTEKTLEQSHGNELEVSCGRGEVNNRNGEEKLHELGKIHGCKRSLDDDGISTNWGGKKKTRSSKSNRDTKGSKLQKSAEAKLDVSPQERSKLPRSSACVTPTSHLNPSPSTEASPVCVGNEYHKQTCRRSLKRSTLWKEMKSLIASSGPEPSPASKETRRRWRDMAGVHLLFSHHLDDDTIKQQRKILARLGASEASSITDATHFVTDKFVRTRNMLEAIALGKPVVAPLWLESCGQAGCFLDEKNYILRDSKKEKEIGFSMPVSLLRASQCPLLQDQRVLITANTKPSKEIISSLVKAVGGQPTERVGRSALRDDKALEDLLILSCEEDYDICIPFLEKGASVYSSELLLNAIIIQKLEYERHRLFADSVKRTRSTVWLKKDGKKFVPVATKNDKQQ